jgi:hypothetical protein
MLVKIENGTPVQWPVTEAHVQATNPRTSFAMPIDEATLSHFGYAALHFSDPAQYDAEWQEAKEIAPAQVGGKWTQQWSIVDRYTTEERAAKEAEKAKFEAIKYQYQRAAEYPPIGDQLDALWKGGDAAAEMLVLVQAVKAKYPKPE